MKILLCCFLAKEKKRKRRKKRKPKQNKTKTSYYEKGENVKRWFLNERKKKQSQYTPVTTRVAPMVSCSLSVFI